jgi:hypothetical protein
MYSKASHSFDEDFVGGKWRAKPKSFEQASKLLDWVYGKGLQSTEYGEWVEREVCRLAPAPSERNGEIDQL